MSKKKNILLSELKSGSAKYAIAMIGNVYGRLNVFMYIGDRILPKGQKQAMILAQCECGNINTYVANHVKHGRSESCGCLQYDLSVKRFTVHGNKIGGMSRGTKEYSIWQAIKGRCKTNIKYIESGITVCKKWENSFPDFLKDVGYKPTDLHTLERLNNTMGYSPENCKWATREEQANNTRRNKFILINGDRVTFAQAKRKYNLGYSKCKTIYKQQNENDNTNT